MVVLLVLLVRGSAYVLRMKAELRIVVMFECRKVFSTLVWCDGCYWIVLKMDEGG